MSAPSSLPALLRVADLAALLHRSENAVRDLLARGDLPGSKLGNQWIVRTEALWAHLANAEEHHQAKSPAPRFRDAGRASSDLARQARAAQRLPA